eukprot:12075463-Alexandrium_andersonii.AAC.1
MCIRDSASPLSERAVARVTHRLQRHTAPQRRLAKPGRRPALRTDEAAVQARPQGGTSLPR